MKKIWCKHIWWGEFSPTDIRLKWVISLSGFNIPVPRSWKLCPVCESERPTRENIKAAELRFAMDNDQ